MNLSKTIQVRRLGRVPYQRALRLQRTLRQLRKRNKIENQLLLLEHDPVYTLGRKKSMEFLLWPPDRIANELKAPVIATDRGGEVTFHGPGTLVGYLIVHLPSLGVTVRSFVDKLEDAMIETCNALGIDAYGRIQGMRGVWTKGKKLGSIGLSVSRYVTMHGIALNVSTDLSYFNPIVACGLQGKTITTLEGELDHEVSMNEVANTLVSSIGSVLGVKPIESSDDWLMATLLSNDNTAWTTMLQEFGVQINDEDEYPITVLAAPKT